MKLTIPCFIRGLNEDVECLMFKFGNARRRAYSMRQKGTDRLEIIKKLHREMSFPTRYVQTAYDMVKGLPPYVTFGGLKLQRFREQSKISREEYHRRRNNLLACRGDASNRGNVCLRVEGDRLRVNIGKRKWIWLPLFVPNKYKGYLDGSKSHTVLLRRRDDGGYDTRITIGVDEPSILGSKCVMALDVNAGHIDFAVVEKQDLKPVAIGKINCHELLSSRRGKNEFTVHKTVNKVRNIARHYGAEVVAGKLKNLIVKGHKRSNRKIHRMSQFRLRQVMRYKLPFNGVKFSERSEAYTSMVGKTLSKPMGVDIHKASAYAFAVKVIDYPKFTFLRGVLSNEGDGILRRRLSGGSGLTALRQQALAHDEARAEATPKFLVWAGGFEPLQNHILQVKV